jgi:hypothetical protein
MAGGLARRTASSTWRPRAAWPARTKPGKPHCGADWPTNRGPSPPRPPRPSCRRCRPTRTRLLSCLDACTCSHCRRCRRRTWPCCSRSPSSSRCEVYALNPCEALLVRRRRAAPAGAAGRPWPGRTRRGRQPPAGRLGQADAASVDLGLAVDACRRRRGRRHAVRAPPGRPRCWRGCRPCSILALEEPAPGAWPLAPQDRSIEVHVCHSLTREIEVLHDRLLGLFATHPQLAPADVLVVTPDLEAAAPLIDAVFGSTPASAASRTR